MNRRKLKTIFYKFLSKHPNGMVKSLYNHVLGKCGGKRKYTAGYWKKRKKSFDKEKYFVLRVDTTRGPGAVILSAAIFVVPWAKKNGYRVAIDNEPKGVYMNGRVGVVDSAFDRLFDSDITVNEALSKDNVYISSFCGVQECDYDVVNYINHSDLQTIFHIDDREYHKRLYNSIREIWKPKSFILNDVERYVSQCFGDGPVLGVSLREEFSMLSDQAAQSDEHLKIYLSHPHPPGIDESLDLVEDYFNKWGCKKIFIASIYKESIEKAVDRFGDRVVFVNRDRKSLSGVEDRIHNFFVEQERDDYEYMAEFIETWTKKNIEYITEIELLSKCDYLIGAPCSATTLASAINGAQYREIYLFEDSHEISSNLMKKR